MISEKDICISDMSSFNTGIRIVVKPKKAPEQNITTLTANVARHCDAEFLSSETELELVHFSQ